MTKLFESTAYVESYLKTLDNPRAYLSDLEVEIADIVMEREFDMNFTIELILAWAGS